MADWKSVELFDDISPGNVQFAFDDYQFVWVDGRFNNVARRVYMDNDGTITYGTIGVPNPQARASIGSVVFNSLKDKGTGIPRGKLLLICYTYTNNEEHESNPSPITVFDTGQYMAKGTWVKDGVSYENPVVDGVYTYENTQNGSIENVVVTVPIIASDLKRVNIYVAYADYPESVIPPSAFLLSESRLITGKEAGDTISVVISSIPTTPEVSYENDVAPKGDDITLADSITFIGNAVNTLGLPGSVSRVWAIDIINNNQTNFVNRFHRIDLYDETVHPDDGSYLEGLELDTADLDEYRIFDEDLSTPLEVFHYPIDEVITLPAAEGVADPEATFATLQVGNQGTVEGMLLTAKNSGTGGNSISFESVIGQSFGIVAADNHDEATYGSIYIETAGGGVHNGSIQLIKPASYETSIVITDNVTDDRHDITIQLATNNDMGFTIASDQGDVLAAITAAMGTGQALDGIITSAYGYGDYDEDYVYPDDNASAVPLAPVPESVSVAADKVSLYICFSSVTEAIVSTVAQAVAAINSNPDAASLLTATADLYPGTGIMAEVSETALSGGTGDTTVSATTTCNTRLLCWIRVPIIRAHADKTLYLVEFNSGSLPEGYEGEFTELESADIADFYNDYVVKNPIPDENVPVAVKYDVDTLISDYLSYEDTLNYNAANLFVVPSGYGNEVKTSAFIPLYDELCAADAVEPQILAKCWGYSSTQSPQNITYDLPQEMTLQGYAWATRRVYQQFYGAENRVLDLDVFRLRYNLIDGTNEFYVAVQLYYDGGAYDATKYLHATSLGISSGDHVSFLMAWDQTVFGGSGATNLSTVVVRLCVMCNSKVVFGELIFEGYGIDTSETISLDVCKALNNSSVEQSYPLNYGVRINENIENIYQAINAIRWMPVYLTEGIGAFSEFAADNDTPANLVFNNTGVSFRTVNTNGDTKPGRLQWGNYGAMPDLNEFVLNEDIMAIAPLKSYMPTDEHNTILIFTKNNVHRLALFGESAQTCKSIKELNGYGLLYRNAICELPIGIAWLSQKGIMLITINGITNLTQSRINTDNITVLTYDRERNWIWARGSYDDDDDTIQVTYVYQIDENIWWSYAGEVHPDDFMGCIDEETGWISYIDDIMYMESDDPHDYNEEEDDPEVENYLTYIKTKAIALVKKLGRIRLISTLSAGTFRFIARMFGHRITDYSTETAEFDGQNNVLTSIPGVGADYVQLDIIEANNIVSISTEYEDGVRNG
jgi:hypothetical protein